VRRKIRPVTRRITDVTLYAGEIGPCRRQRQCRSSGGSRRASPKG